MRTSDDDRECKPCAQCGGISFETVYSWRSCFFDHAVYETSSWDGREALDLRIVRCTACELVQSNPSFRAECLDKVYATDLIPEAVDSTAVLGQKKWSLILSAITESLPAGGTVCDVGTRYGGFVHQAGSRGYRAFGIERNEASVEQALKLGIPDVHQGVIGDLPRICDEQGFRPVDAFVMDDVVEHLVNPVHDLSLLGSLQRQGGLLFMRQMSWESLGHRLYGKRWYYLQPAAHMYYFSPTTLGNLLRKSGYEVVEVRHDTVARSAKKLVTNTLRDLFEGKRQRRGRQGLKPLYLRKQRGLADMFLMVARKTGEPEADR